MAKSDLIGCLGKTVFGELINQSDIIISIWIFSSSYSLSFLYCHIFHHQRISYRNEFYFSEDLLWLINYDDNNNEQ